MKPGVVDASRRLIKCRIPQRLTGRQKTPVARPRIPNTAEATKSKMDEMPAPYSQNGVKTMHRIRCDEPLRPKSASRVKDDVCNSLTHHAARPVRDTIAPKRPSTIPKITTNDNAVPSHPHKLGRAIITKQQDKSFHVPKIVAGLPDQETIKKHEDLELHHSEYSNQTCTELKDQADLIPSWSDKVMRLQTNWHNKLAQFEKMKNELGERQTKMMELYASMQVTHKQMWALGQKAELPPADDFRVMNVAKLTPVQLLQLCAKSRYIEEKVQDTQALANIPLTLDVNKMYNLPAKIVDTCEETLFKMKEIIDWFESIRTVDKRISMHSLTKKLGEFTKENEKLNCSLEKAKNECYKELNDIVGILRKGVNETMALHLRTEELTFELSELNSQNDDLRKQIHNVDHQKSHQHNKYRYEELEKELKEEKSKKVMMRERLSRAEGQVKSAADRISQLEATLEQNRSQSRAMERTIQQLHDQNHNLQVDFDMELNKLTESIKENMNHLEEIADSRQKLQFEKEELEKRLENLSEQYNESLNNLKQEMNVCISKGLDSDKKYQEVVEDKTNLEEKVASLRAQLIESELQYKDLRKQLQDSELQLSKSTNCKLELEASKRDLDIANAKIEEYKNRLMTQSEAIKEIEQSLIETLELEDSHKRDLINKDEYIVELEKKHALLEQQLQESESKITSYKEQLSTLKQHISKLQEDFGYFENLNELRQMINQQRAKLLETTRQNAELTGALQNKDKELKNRLDNLAEQERLLEQRCGTIKILTEKEEEQANIIKLLRNNLEMRTQADTNFNQQLYEKNEEINSLISTVETREQQISEFEKIILTLEDQRNKANVQICQLEKVILSLEDERRKFQEKLFMLENKIQEYETRQRNNKRVVDSPTDNLDNIIKILENELGMRPFDPQINTKDQSYVTKRKIANHNEPNNIECHNVQISSIQNDLEPDTMPTKIVTGNFVKKTYMTTREVQSKSEGLDRKRAISISPHEWNSSESEVRIYDSVSSNNDHTPYKVPIEPSKENYLARNLRYLMADQLRNDKKMIKFAGHRL